MGVYYLFQSVLDVYGHVQNGPETNDLVQMYGLAEKARHSETLIYIVHVCVEELVRFKNVPLCKDKQGFAIPVHIHVFLTTFYIYITKYDKA